MFGHRYFGAAYFGPRYWGPAGDVVPTPEPEVQRQAAGGIRKRRRQIVFKDGRKVEARTEAEFQRLIWEMLDEAQIKEFTPPKTPKKRKPGKAQPQPYVVQRAVVNALRSSLMDELGALRHQALTEQAIISLAMLAIQKMQDDEEEAALMLLLS